MLKKIIEEGPDDMTGTAKTPAAGHLFKTNENCENLSKKKAQGFQHLVAKLLYLCRHTHPVIQMVVVYLCTGINSPNADDYKKMTCVILYPRGMPDLTLTIKPGGIASGG